MLRVTKKTADRRISKDGRTYLFHKDHPKGMVFINPDLEEMAEQGWVDNPAKLEGVDPDEPEAIDADKVKSMSPSDIANLAKSFGYKVFTDVELTAEIGKNTNYLSLKDVNDEDLLAEVSRRGLEKESYKIDLTLLERFNEDPKSLNKEEHIILGKELGLTLRINWGEDTMIDKITEALNNEE